MSAISGFAVNPWITEIRQLGPEGSIEHVQVSDKLLLGKSRNAHSSGPFLIPGSNIAPTGHEKGYLSKNAPLITQFQKVEDGIIDEVISRLPKPPLNGLEVLDLRRPPFGRVNLVRIHRQAEMMTELEHRGSILVGQDDKAIRTAPHKHVPQRAVGLIQIEPCPSIRIEELPPGGEKAIAAQRGWIDGGSDQLLELG